MMGLRHGISCAVLLAAPFSLFGNGLPDAGLTGTGPTPDWVTKIEAPATKELPADSAGTAYLLVDDQFRPKANAYFGKRVFRFLSVAGVEDSSSLVWHLDPDYERFTLHSLRITRGEEVIDLLDLVRIRLSNTYQDDVARSYDNEVEARIILPDARVGDVVEYSWSVNGGNPVTGDRFAFAFEQSWRTPVERLHFRVLWEGDRPLRWRPFNQADEPVVTPQGDAREYVWARENSDPVDWEDAMPPEAYAQDWVQLTDWESWGEVSRWGAGLYPLDAPLPEALEPVLEGLHALPDPADRILGAIRYVQDEIRYVSMVFGPHNYKPFPPEEIGRRRYGDCKDKALVLSLLLRELGVEAVPTLVDIDDRATVADMLPSPRAFDHVIVRFRHGENVHYVDPTITLQGGGLDSLHVPPYGVGLPLRPEGDTLQEGVGLSGATAGSIHLAEKFVIPSWEGESTLTAVTTYRGFEADDMRRSLAGQALRDLSRDFREFYAAYYGPLESVEPLAVKDDREANVLVLNEHYRVEDLFVPETGGDPGDEFQYFEAGFVYDLLPTAPQGTARKHDFWIPPVDARQTIRLHLPDDSTFQEVKEVIENPYVRCEYSVVQNGRILDIAMHYEALRSQVPPEDYEAFAADIARMEDLVSYGIVANLGVEASSGEDSGTVAPSFRLNLALALVSLLVLALTSLVAIGLFRVPRPGGFPAAGGGPVGIRGWLILPAIGVVLMPIRACLSLGNVLPWYDAAVWRAGTDPASDSYMPGLEALLLFNVTAIFFLIPVALLVAIAFYSRRWFVPRLMQAVLGVSALILTVDTTWSFAVLEVGDDERARMMGAVIGSWVSFGIWALYFSLSRRVRNTFQR